MCVWAPAKFTRLWNPSLKSLDRWSSIRLGLGHAGKETPGKLLLFIVLRETDGFDDFLANRIRERIRIELSPRYVPDGIFQVPEIPQTLNGKKLEVPVKRIFLGIELSKSVSREAMSNPDSLKPFLELAEKYLT